MKLVPVCLAPLLPPLPPPLPPLDLISEFQIVNNCSLFRQAMVMTIPVMMMMTFLCLTRKEVIVVEMR